MKVFYPDPHLPHIIGQILSHTLGQGSHQNLIALVHLLIDFTYKVVDLSFHRADRDLRIQKSCRADDLFRPKQFVISLIIRWSCRYKHHLIDLALELPEIQGPVVQGGRQTEPIFHQCGLAGSVARIHPPHLRQRNMRLVDNDEKIIRKVINQSVRRFPRFASCQMSGIILNPGAEAGLPHHLHIKICPLGDTLGLQQLILAFKISHLLFHLLQDLFGRLLHPLLGNHVVGGRKDGHMAQLGFRLSCEGINLGDPLHLVPEKLYPVGL